MKNGIDHIGNAAVTLCHDGKGKYLLGLRSDKCRDEHFKWDAIGTGGIEHGETIEATIRREVKEECGSDVVHIEMLGIREVFREHEGRVSHWIQFDHLVQVDPEQIINVESDKCLELRWCTIDEIPEPRHSQFPAFLEKYKDRLI